MAAGLPLPSTNENISTTLSTGISDVATSIDVADASKIVAPCYLVVDRVDGTGTLKSTSFWEYIKVTNVASNTLTVTRAQGGSTAQSHSAGAVVEAVVTSSMFEDWYAALNPEHTASGGHVIGTATVNYTQTHNLVVTSIASIAQVNFDNLTLNRLSVSGASITGLERTVVFSVIGSASGPTTSVLRWVATFPGTFRSFVLAPRNMVSGASLVVTAFKNGNTSIFDTLTMPSIAGGGTFVSTASIKNASFNRGDIIRMDIVSGALTDDPLFEGVIY